MTDDSRHDRSGPAEPGCAQPDLAALSDGDARALDWLAENGWQHQIAPADVRSRASAAGDLLTPLGPPLAASQPGETWMGVAFAGAVASIEAATSAADSAQLTEEDADALDAWILAEGRVSRVPLSLRERASAHDQIHRLLTASADASLPHDGLIDRALAAIDGFEAASGDRAASPRGRLTLSDLGSIAAILIVGAAVLWPAVNMQRARAVQSSNQANMAASGLAFGAYAMDHEDRLPMVSRPDPAEQWVWWRVGTDPDSSNSANLYALHRFGYARQASLNSPGNPNAPAELLPPGALDWRSFDEVSYSYTLSADAPGTFSPAMTLVLADRSPVTMRAHRGQPVFLNENSMNHRGRGQHVLMGDGGVGWLTSPVTATGDHIYLPRPIERLVRSVRDGQRITFEEMVAPGGRADAFVGP